MLIFSDNILFLVTASVVRVDDFLLCNLSDEGSSPSSVTENVISSAYNNINTLERTNICTTCIVCLISSRSLTNMEN